MRIPHKTVLMAVLVGLLAFLGFISVLVSTLMKGM